MGFQPLLDKPYIWIHLERQIQILLYVDDILIAAYQVGEIDQFKSMIPFRYKDLGKPARFLGSSLSRNNENGAIFLNQAAYTKEVIIKSGLQDASYIYLPIKIGYKYPDITKDLGDKDVRKEQKDNDGVGSQAYDKPSVSKEEALAFIEDISKLGWLADKSRPNIVVAVNKLQRRVSAPR